MRLRSHQKISDMQIIIPFTQQEELIEKSGLFHVQGTSKQPLGPSFFWWISLLLIAVFWVGDGTVANAQGLGMVIEDEAYDQLPVLSDASMGAKGSFPNRVDLSPYCPLPGNQGLIQSCVGWASAYGALTIEQAVQNEWTDKQLITAEAFSPMFIFNQIKLGNCSLGSKVVDAMRFLQENGTCKIKDFKVDVNDCETQPDERLREKAEVNRIEDYLALFKRNASFRIKLRNVKTVLAARKPIITGLRVRNNFLKLKAISEESTRAVSWWPNIDQDTTSIGGHALVVVGYDDNFYARRGGRKPLQERGAVKVFNSWGAEWGSNGFAWIRYDYFFEFCKYAITITTAGDEPLSLKDFKDRVENQPYATAQPQQRHIEGTFSFKYFTGGYTTDNVPIFEPIPVRYQNGYYEALGKWRIGDAFQLSVETGFDKGYIYVLSVDATGNAEVYFPRDEKLNQKFVSQRESALIMQSGSLLTIPGEKQALQLTKVGTEHLIALFSERKIRLKDVQFLCQQLTNAKDQVPELINSFVSMIPEEDRFYQPDAMSVKVDTESKGRIVPIILEVNAQ